MTAVKEEYAMDTFCEDGNFHKNLTILRRVKWLSAYWRQLLSVGLVIWIMVLLCITITLRRILCLQIVLIELSSLKLSLKKRKLSKFLIRFLIKCHSHRCRFSILGIDGSGEKRALWKMGTTVIGMKFNQAVVEKCCMWHYFSLGPFPPSPFETAHDNS